MGEFKKKKGGEIMTEPIYTVEEVSERLRVPVGVIEQEIAAGKLSALKIGPFPRIRGAAVDAYLELASTTPSAAETGSLDFRSVSDFDYVWPDGKHEHFTDARETVVPYGGKSYHIKVAFTFRNSSGKRRRRSLVLVDRYASVEFVAADDQTTGRMASIIRDRSGKHLPIGATLPPEYQGLPTGPYREVVEGSGAANGLAVICDAGDLELMVKHALIRYQFRKDRL
jgi:excisionase family DNA binding protein